MYQNKYSTVEVSWAALFYSHDSFTLIYMMELVEFFKSSSPVYFILILHIIFKRTKQAASLVFYLATTPVTSDYPVFMSLS